MEYSQPFYKVDSHHARPNTHSFASEEVEIQHLDLVALELRLGV